MKIIFLSWLTIELFYCLQHFCKTSFSEYLEKRLNNIPSQNNIDENEIEKDLDKVLEDEIENICEDIEYLKEDNSHTNRKKLRFYIQNKNGKIKNIKDNE